MKLAVLRLKLLGLNRKQVNKHLEQLSTSQTQELAELQEKIQQCRREREQLGLERAKMKTQIPDSDSLALLELARQRVQQAVKLIRDSAAEDAVLVAEEVKEKIKLQEKKVLEIEEEIKAAKRQINLESFRISRCLIPEQVTKEQPGVKTPPVPKAEPTYSVGKQSLAEVQSEHAVEKPEAMRRPQVGAKNGTASSQQLVENIQDIENQHVLPGLRVEPMRAEELALDIVGQTARNEAAPTIEVESKSGTAVSDRIDAIRRKYITGKLAGEDLLTNEGLVIVKKNSVITQEIMERAKAEGKLAELIINMIIPELEIEL